MRSYKHLGRSDRTLTVPVRRGLRTINDEKQLSDRYSGACRSAYASGWSF